MFDIGFDGGGGKSLSFEIAVVFERLGNSVTERCNLVLFVASLLRLSGVIVVKELSAVSPVFLAVRRV